MKKIFTICTLLCLAFTIQAQVWKEVGPIPFPTNSSGQINGLGRVTQLKFHPTLANKIYATSASGGLYMTSDTGHHWNLLGTDVLPQCNLASVCIDYTNDQTMYLGTGDPNYYGTDLGIYKTTNGGALWTAANTGLPTVLAVEILMDPSNNQKLILATNNGIWQSLNGAASWTNVKSGGAFTHMIQIPSTNTLMAVTSSSQVWRSTDFGSTWTQITNTSFVQSGADGMRVCVNTNAPNIVYVVSNGANGVVYKSSDAGLNFSLIYSSTTQCLVCYDEDPLNAGQGNYDMAACCDPLNENHLYIAAHCLWESNDGGLSWERKTSWPAELHTDHHQFSFSPYDNTKFWSANDGGVWLREGLNDSLWQPMCDGISAMEMYHTAASPIRKKLMSGGTQDNGEVYHDATGWYTNRGGDWGSRMLYDYSSQNNVYYLENGERRGFTPQTGGNSYNSPFTPTNNSRIAFTKADPEMAVLSKDSLWFTNNLSSATPTWNLLYPTTSGIRDLVISSADNTIAYAINSTKLIRVKNINSTPTATVYTSPASSSTRGSVATVKNHVNVIYISCNTKIYRSTDTGTTWTNVSYNLPGTTILKIYHDDFSPNETMYVCSGNKIFTKTLSDTVWVDISGALPKIAAFVDFMLVNDSSVASKLMVGYYGRGVWEYKLHPTYPAVADFEIDNAIICTGNSVQFNNLSSDDSLTYNWTFAGGTPATSTQENPLITYNTPGNYSVSLTTTNPYGSNTKTVNSMIQVLASAPSVDSLPSKTLALDGTATSYANAGKMNLNSNHVTISCWIKPQGAQHDWGGIVFCRGGSTCSGISIKDDNEIRFHWAGNDWWVTTNLYANDNEWNYCALVITPTSTTLYVNNKSFTTTATNTAEVFDGDLVFGADFNSGGRRFTGLIDEVCIYNKSLSQNEIREQMHLVKKNNIPADSLKGYWQMNDITASNTILNKARCENQASLSNTCSLIASTAPIGKGTSVRKTVTAAGLINAGVADMNLNFAASNPNGEICLTHLSNSPDEMPLLQPSAGNYWIIDNYGTDSTFTMLNSMQLLNAGFLNGTASQYALYNRGPNADGATWSGALCTASSMVAGANGSVQFTAPTQIDAMGQFVLTGPYTAVNTTQIESSTLFTLYPNPASTAIYIENKTQKNCSISFYTIDGKLIAEQHSNHASITFDCSTWAQGIYFYEIRSEENLMNGKVEVR